MVYLYGGGFKDFLCSLQFGEDEPILTNIFQRGWHHQPDLICFVFSVYKRQKWCCTIFHLSQRAIRPAFDFFPVFSMACFVARRLHPGISPLRMPWRCSIPRSHLCVWWRSLRASLVSLKSRLAGWKNVGRKPCFVDRQKEEPYQHHSAFQFKQQFGGWTFFLKQPNL